MTRRAGAVLAVALLASLAGCARVVSLDVSYPAAAVNRGPLASVPARDVGVPAVVDRRVDATRVGLDPTRRKDVVTSRPVGDIVREALVAELSRNGHTVRAEAKDVVLAAEVEEFWVDVVVGYSSAQYFGKVVVAVAVVDGSQGRPLFTRHYAGTRRREAEVDSPQAAREVLDTALARAVHDIATDPQLVAALGGRLRL